jgi:uncharacterized protein with FMN-binding domain
MKPMRKSITATLSAFVLVIPVANAVAAAKTPATTLVVPKKKVVTKKVTGPQAQADRWGYVQVVLTIKKTTITVGKHTKVTRKISAISIPVYPDHTDRSVYISHQALPYLMQETLQAQSANIQMVSGATISSNAYIGSLQAAIALEQKV